MKIYRIAQSKVIVWHGSGNTFSGAASSFLGDWFGTDNIEYAKQYGNPQAFEIQISRPYNMPFAEFYKFDRATGKSIAKGQMDSKQRREELQQNGYDSIIVVHRDGSKEYILFNKNNAKPTNQQPQPIGQMHPSSQQVQQQYTNEKPFPNANNVSVEIPAPSQNNLDVW